MKHLRILWVLAGSALAAQAQENFFRVYQYETPLAGWAEPALWTTHIAQSDETEKVFGRERSRDGLWAHSAELEFGVTDHLSLAGYADFADYPNEVFRYAQARLEARYRFGQPHDHFVDAAVYAEYVFPRDSFSDQQELELRGILQKDIEDFRFVVNPRLSFPTTGGEAGSSPDAGLDAGIYFRRSRRVQPGLEAYVDLGKLSALERRSVVVMPTLDVLLGRHLVWQLGAGRGVSGDTDRWMIKSLVRVEFDAIRPSRWFRH